MRAEDAIAELRRAVAMARSWLARSGVAGPQTIPSVATAAAVLRDAAKLDANLWAEIERRAAFVRNATGGEFETAKDIRCYVDLLAADGERADELIGVIAEAQRLGADGCWFIATAGDAVLATAAWESLWLDDIERALDVLGLLEADGGDVSQLVTLDQMAAFARRSKRTLQLWQQQDEAFPTPAVEGGGGKAALWRWADVREYISQRTGIPLPDRFPDLR